MYENEIKKFILLEKTLVVTQLQKYNYPFGCKIYLDGDELKL
jgi:hypothetical protein